MPVQRLRNLRVDIDATVSRWADMTELQRTERVKNLLDEMQDILAAQVQAERKQLDKKAS